MEKDKEDPREENIEQVEYSEDLFNNGSAYDTRPRNTKIKRGSGRMGGRSKGSINERTKRIKEYMLHVIEGISPEQDILDLMNMKPYERQRIKLEIAEFLIPKLQRAEISQDLDVEKVIIVELPKQLHKIEEEIGYIEDKTGQVENQSD